MWGWGETPTAADPEPIKPTAVQPQSEPLAVWDKANHFYDSLTPTQMQYVLFGSGFVTGILASFWIHPRMNAMYTKHFKRISTGEYVTPEMISGQHWIKGKVTSVGDSDGFRLYHTPGFGWRWPFKFRSVPSTNKELQNQTLSIRMAGIDAPEGAHWGRPSQLWAQESLDWLKSQVEGKWVYCQILRKDQYSRIVAMPYVKYRFIPRFISKGRPLSLEMVRAGWAVTYEQANAEYGGYPKEEYTRLEAEAQAAKRGMWKNGPLIETPAEYKRKYASSVETAEAALSEATVVPSSKTTQKKVSQGTKAEGGWVSWLFGRKR